MKNIEIKEALKNAGVTHEELAGALRTDKKTLENRECKIKCVSRQTAYLRTFFF